MCLRVRVCVHISQEDHGRLLNASIAEEGYNVSDAYEPPASWDCAVLRAGDLVRTTQTALLHAPCDTVALRPPHGDLVSGDHIPPVVCIESHFTSEHACMCSEQETW